MAAQCDVKPGYTMKEVYDEVREEIEQIRLSSHHRIDRFARPAGPNGSHHRLRIELRHAPDTLRHPGFVFHFLSSKENRNVRTYGTKKDHYSCDITQNIINRDYSAAK